MGFTMSDEVLTQRIRDNSDDTFVVTRWQDMPDELLIEIALSGDKRALDQLFARYKKQTYFSCLKMLHGDRAQALDLCQEAFISAYKNLSQLYDRKNFKGWLSVITRNICLSFLRQQATFTKMISDYEVVMNVILEPGDEWSDAEIQLVHDLINGIKNPSMKETIVLYYIEGKKTNDIAEIQNLTQSAVTTRLDRFRLKISRRLIREILS
jgi:RNA polymerase sigma factor (sigma-70 family)